MATESQIKTWQNEIIRREKKIIDIRTKAERDIANEQKLIMDLKRKIANG